VSATSVPAAGSVEQTLRDVIEPLAAIERGAGSPGEREAAELLHEMFKRAGVPAQVDDEWFRMGYARLLLPLGVVGLITGLSAARGRRSGLLAALSAAATAALIDDVENGKRWYRNAVAKPQKTQNVVAVCGDLEAERTLVVMAHHDAAPTGAIFDQTGQRWIAKRFPQVIERSDTGVPFWWPAAGATGISALGAATGSRILGRIGTAFATLNVALGLDIGRHRIVPGANDNLSGVGALVALAERLTAEPVSGIRVVLASCGAEEVLQGGIYGFLERHLEPLDPQNVWVLNLDTVGCPELILIEGEGPFVMHDYDEEWRDLIATVAERATGAPLRRGIRARASSDSIVPSRAGFRTVMLGSWEPDTKAISNYHLPTDTPDKLRYETIGRAVDIAEALARELAA
jgi:hypothetical protein